jgi:hypothetical protein
LEVLEQKDWIIANLLKEALNASLFNECRVVTLIEADQGVADWHSAIVLCSFILARKGGVGEHDLRPPRVLSCSIRMVLQRLLEVSFLD